MRETALSHRRLRGNWRAIRPPARRPRPRPGPGRPPRRPLERLAAELPTDAHVDPLRPRHRRRLAARPGRGARSRGRPAGQQRRLRHLGPFPGARSRRATPSRSGSTARRSSPSPTPSCPGMVERGRGGIINVASTRRHAADPLRSRLRGHQGVRDQLHRRAAHRAAGLGRARPRRQPGAGADRVAGGRRLRAGASGRRPRPDLRPSRSSARRSPPTTAAAAR